MSYIQRSLDTFVGLYDFSEIGGAIGSYNLGINIPQNASALEFGIQVVTPLTSGGLATVSFDAIQTDVNPNVTTVGYFSVATGFAAIGVAGDITFGKYPGGATTFTPASFRNTSNSIGMSIAVAPLTAGKLIILCRCIMFDFS